MIGRRGKARAAALEERVASLEERLDHERLFPVEWANRRVRDRLGDTVRAGPFTGMRYPDWALADVDLYSPKVLGAFERELGDAIETAIRAQPRVVVNIGSAEGYYAVGLARRLPHARVVAFDTNAEKLGQLAAIADLNGVEVETRAEACTHAELGGVVEPGALVVCDCDGCEDVVLDPQAVMALARCELIVEAHDLLKAGITDRLREAFATTHEIDTIPAEPRYVDDFPELGDIPLVTRQLAISEFRGGPMWWLVMRSAA